MSSCEDSNCVDHRLDRIATFTINPRSKETPKNTSSSTGATTANTAGMSTSDSKERFLSAYDPLSPYRIAPSDSQNGSSKPNHVREDRVKSLSFYSPQRALLDEDSTLADDDDDSGNDVPRKASSVVIMNQSVNRYIPLGPSHHQTAPGPRTPPARRLLPVEEGFLEMEDTASHEPDEDRSRHHDLEGIGDHADDLDHSPGKVLGADPIRTTSGLLLTHRKTPTEIQAGLETRSNSHASRLRRSHPTTPSFPLSGRHDGEQDDQDPKYHRSAFSSLWGTPLVHQPRTQSSWPSAPSSSLLFSRLYLREQKLELDHNDADHDANHHLHHSGSQDQSFLNHLRRVLSLVKLWVLLSALVLFSGTLVLWGHARQEGRMASVVVPDATTNNNDMVQLDFSRQPGQHASSSTTTSTVRLVPLPEDYPIESFTHHHQHQYTDRIVLRPLPEFSTSSASAAQGPHGQRSGHADQYHRHLLMPGPPATLPMMPSHDHHTQQKQHSLHNHHAHHQQPDHGLLHVFGHQNHNNHHLHHDSYLADLRAGFEDWIQRHGKIYSSHQEKEQRFHIWKDNHQQTQHKNAKHGPCKLTNQAVFGSNHFQDLTAQEFKEKYLTGYRAVRADEVPQQQQQKPLGSVGVLGPHIVPNHHPEIQRRIQELGWWGDQPPFATKDQQKKQRRLGKTSFQWSIPNNTGCDWYDFSCILQYIFETYFYGLGQTMEPAYDESSYPKSVDWRKLGAVTSVHKQGSCGACWAITAVETVESAVFLGTGKLYDLSSTEVILCEEESQMCSGGWPQNAFDYVKQYGGVPLSSDLPYDGDMLLAITSYKAGESDSLNSETVQTYINKICPTTTKKEEHGDNKQGEGKKDGENKEEGASSSSSSSSSSSNYGFTRYGGEIEGYGYATKKCVCYTDGSGCDCANQNEGLAVRNLATYGPAVVCLDASTWQDYNGGIITADSGCSSGFMDVNHCVQAVGYAYFTDDEEKDESGQRVQEDRDDGRNDNGKEGGKDAVSRSGYWIVRNQWSAYWGLNGYAWVAMGENTCGILNDMLQAYV